MKLSELKRTLKQPLRIRFPATLTETLVPKHFHVTEVGQVQKHFIDCGGTEEKETLVNFQLWKQTILITAPAPVKLKDIITLSEKVLKITEMERLKSNTVKQWKSYGIAFNGKLLCL